MKTVLAILMLASALAAPALADTSVDLGVSAMPPGITPNSPKQISSHIAGLVGVRFGKKFGVLVFERVNPYFLSHVVARPGAAVVYQAGRHLDIGAGLSSREELKRSWAPTFLVAYKFR